MAHDYGLPIFGLGGASDSKIPDEQAATEVAFSLLTETLAGAHLIHDVGYLEGGMTNSLEMVVMADEMIRWVKEFMRGEVVNEETLALDWIDKAGHKGDFLALKHTRNHYHEDWYPDLFNRTTYANWAEQGKKSLRERAREKIDQILTEHQPEPLPDDIARGVQAVIDRTFK
jgi:trimethylamine--corrinoid protein Co-methyltransferase